MLNLKNEFIEWFFPIAPKSYRTWFGKNLNKKLDDINDAYKASFEKSLFDIDIDNIDRERLNIIKNIENRNKAPNKTFVEYDKRSSNGISKTIINKYYTNFLVIYDQKEIVLNPLIGIQINDRRNKLKLDINLGENLEGVKNILGEENDDIITYPQNCPFDEECDLYFENLDIHFCFNDNDILEYIECGIECLISSKVSIYGYDLYEMPLRDLYDVLSKYCKNKDEDHSDYRNINYAFEDIGVRYKIGYRGEDPAWIEKEINSKDEYEFYWLTSIGIGTKNVMDN
jgi:hypothetical protein